MGVFNGAARKAARVLIQRPSLRQAEGEVLVREVVLSFIAGLPKSAKPGEEHLAEAYAAAKAEVELMAKEVWQLRNALMFYGNPLNYQRDEVVPSGAYVRLASRVEIEGGEKARALVGDLIADTNRRSGLPPAAARL